MLMVASLSVSFMFTEELRPSVRCVRTFLFFGNVTVEPHSARCLRSEMGQKGCMEWLYYAVRMIEWRGWSSSTLRRIWCSRLAQRCLDIQVYAYIHKDMCPYSKKDNENEYLNLAYLTDEWMQPPSRIPSTTFLRSSALQYLPILKKNKTKTLMSKSFIIFKSRCVPPSNQKRGLSFGARISSPAL